MFAELLCFLFCNRSGALIFSRDDGVNTIKKYNVDGRFINIMMEKFISTFYGPPVALLSVFPYLCFLTIQWQAHRHLSPLLA